MRLFYLLYICLLFSINNTSYSFFEDIEFEGELFLSGRYFPSGPEYSSQKNNNSSLALKTEFFYEFEQQDSIVVSPFIRLDSSDSNRSKADLREFLYTSYGEDWELSFGIGQVFWGVAESKNLVDMVNQVDEVEDAFGLTKLGQPLANLTFIRDEGYFEAYVMPYFRPRTLPGKKGRLRTDPHFLKNNPKFEGGNQWTPELALRWLNTYGEIDLSAHLFFGYAKNPSIDIRVIDGITNYGAAYQRIRQLGGTLQRTSGSTLYKMEYIVRDGQRDANRNRNGFISTVTGIEYNFYRIMGDNTDLSLILEYIYDSRRDRSSELLQDDLFMASRWSLNDNFNSEVFVSSIFDLDGDGQTYQFEFSRRITDSLSGTLKSAIYQNGRKGSTLYILRQDSWLEVEFKYFF